MSARVLRAALFIIQIASTLCENNDTNEAKTKRGTYLPEELVYNPASVKIQDISQIDLTYKSLDSKSEETQTPNNYFPYTNYAAPTKTSFTAGDALHQPQQAYAPHHYTASTTVSNVYAQPTNNPYVQSTVNPYAQHQQPTNLNPYAQSPTVKTLTENPIVGLTSPQFSLAQYPGFQPKITYLAGDKIHFPATVKISEFKLPEYADAINNVPIVYGQPLSGAYQPFKYYAQPVKAQYTVAPSYSALGLAQYKLQPKPPQTYPYQQQQRQVVHHPNAYSSQLQNLKSGRPNVFYPHSYNGQHRPQNQFGNVQSPFDMFTKNLFNAPIMVPVTNIPAQPSAPPPPSSSASPPPSPPPKEPTDDDVRDNDGHRNRDDDDDRDDDNDDEHDEEAFNKGYEESARGFPAYGKHDDDVDEDYEADRNRFNDESESRYNKFRSRYEKETDDSRAKFENSRPPYNDYYDDDDDDHEADYSVKHNKKEKHRDAKYAPAKPSFKQSYESKKRHRSEGDDRRAPTKKPTPSRYYQPESSSSSQSKPRKPNRDSRYAGSSTKKRTSKRTNQQDQQRKRERSKPKTERPKGEFEDSDARHSSPASAKTFFKENWFVSKSKTQK